MRLRVAAACAALCGLMLSACSPAASTPTPIAISESFFSGRAFVDTNGNGVLDDGDNPLKDALFIVKVQSTEFGGLTDAGGNAFVTVPGSLQYPVTVLMGPPQDGMFVRVGPSSISVARPGDKADFLFRPK